MRRMWVRSAPASAATVRHSLTFDMERAGLGRDLADDAALLASELVSNAIRHAAALPSGHLVVDWDIDATGVRIQVADGGSDRQPAVRQTNLDDTSGRGLAIVAALADDWGVEPNAAGGTTVWAHVSRAKPTT